MPRKKEWEFFLSSTEDHPRTVPRGCCLGRRNGTGAGNGLDIPGHPDWDLEESYTCRTLTGAGRWGAENGLGEVKGIRSWGPRRLRKGGRAPAATPLTSLDSHQWGFLYGAVDSAAAPSQLTSRGWELGVPPSTIHSTTPLSNPSLTLLDLPCTPESPSLLSLRDRS